MIKVNDLEFFLSTLISIKTNYIKKRNLFINLDFYDYNYFIVLPNFCLKSAVVNNLKNELMRLNLKVFFIKLFKIDYKPIIVPIKNMNLETLLYVKNLLLDLNFNVGYVNVYIKYNSVVVYYNLSNLIDNFVYIKNINEEFKLLSNINSFILNFINVLLYQVFMFLNSLNYQKTK